KNKLNRFLLLLPIFLFWFASYGQKSTIKKEIEILDPICQWQTDFSTCFSNGKLTLRKSVLYQDEEGRTHYANVEKINSGTTAKKQFLLSNPLCWKAELFVFYGTGLNLTCNGVLVKNSDKLPSTGWSVWNIPVDLLKKGINDFVFTGDGMLLIEPSLYPNRSARSFDNGKTWDFDALGINNGNGEYLVRLRLQQYPKKGTATSKVYDLLAYADGGPIHGRFIAAKKLRLSREATIPSGTAVHFQYRTGDTKLYQIRKWSSWKDFKKNGNFWLIDGPIDKRFVQFRALLTTTRYDRAPSVYKISIRVEVAYGKPPNGLKVIEWTDHQLQQTSIPFVYQGPDYRTKALRSIYRLDDVVKNGKTEFEKLVLLRNWARHTAPKGWDWGTSMWCPPWDALIILATNKQPVALCMCTHYSTIFTQCAISLGYTARHVILDHHCVAEVWSDQFGKWILMDTGNSQNPEMNCHLEYKGIPLNALEIRNLWKSGKSREIRFVYANDSGITQEEKNKFESSYFNNFRRFAIPLRNNFLGNPEPGEPEQGMSEYYCDMYLWWEDNPEPVESPEYGKTSNNPVDFYWTINQTFIDLTVENDNTITVNLYNNTPSFSHYLVSINGGNWKKSQEQFIWNITDGKNELAVKSVNLFGLECPVSRVVIEK
ncbi:MAG: transglutaminase-like domain-containing protein, partial [Candidatus Omnitrophica bacterium]|nr:transglutaminase-like domain-containing protein [Candidatus Omnitrophota bacterium]